MVKRILGTRRWMIQLRLRLTSSSRVCSMSRPRSPGGKGNRRWRMFQNRYRRSHWVVLDSVPGSPQVHHHPAPQNKYRCESNNYHSNSKTSISSIMRTKMSTIASVYRRRLRKPTTLSTLSMKPSTKASEKKWSITWKSVVIAVILMSSRRRRSSTTW